MPDTAARVTEDASHSGREALWRAVRSVVQAQRMAAPLQRMRHDTPSPASFGQQRLWFLEQLTPGTAIHNQTMAYRFVGRLSVPALKRAFGEIVRRHQALRTTFKWCSDGLLQDVHPPSDFTICVEDLRGCADADRMPMLEAATEHEACKPFDIDRSPLLRAKLFRLADDEHRLVVTFQHLAIDGWSFDVFMRELCALYTAYVEGTSSPLKELEYQYSDWSAWQRVSLTGDKLHNLLAYWQEQMRDPPPELGMPTAHSRPGLQRRRGNWHPLTISPALTQQFKNLAVKEGATNYMALLAVFQILLYRYTAQEDIVVGSPVANRHHSAIKQLIGLFVNTLPIRTRVSGSLTFRELLARVRTTVLGAYEHQELPFELLVQTLGATSRSNATPLFRVMFAFQNLPRSDWHLPELSIKAWNVGNGISKFDVTLFLWNSDDGFAGLVEYDADLYETHTVAQWMKHFTALLKGIVCNPDAPVAKLPLLDDAERRVLLHDWNATRVSYPRDLPVHRVFAQRAGELPDAVALAFEGGTTTYAELERSTNRLARHLRRYGVARGSLVGVCLNRSPSLVSALLAILKAGAAYVPVEPSWPASRCSAVLACADLVVTETAFIGRFHALRARVLNLDDCAEAIHRASDEPLNVPESADDIAYVMHTSGSTGEPKGVCVPHRGIVRLVQGANYADLTAKDVFLQLAPVAFDASTFEIWGALLNGATLAVPLAPHAALDDIGLAIRRFDVSILWLTTGLFEVMVDARLDDLRGVRQLLTGGQVLSMSHAERFIRRWPDCVLINCYGPTENTTFTTFHPVQLSSCEPGRSIPIGRPVSNSQVYVLDKLLEPVPIGVAGHAYVGGDGLMWGYLEHATSTRKGLVRNFLADCPGEWLYHTGDVVRWRSDGSLEFLGRDDDEVKIRGFRVAPTEIEAVLKTCPDVRSTAVIALHDAVRGNHLRAFVVPEPGTRTAEQTISGIRDFVRQRLPDYLVPSEFVLIKELPLGENGKVDRDVLRTTAPCAPRDKRSIVAPRDGHEQEIVCAFGQVLTASPIGTDTNFFDSGGDSLSALHLLALLEDVFAIDLPLASLYEDPTPAGLARLISRLIANGSATPARREPQPPMIEVKRGRAVAPLFLVPGGNGGMSELALYAKVLSYVRCNQAVYGFVAQGPDGSATCHASVGEMAKVYVAAVRRQQPQGPYMLAGECIGGLIALEMAQQLLSEQQEVSLLLLLDTWCPTPAGTLLQYRQMRIASECAYVRDLTSYLLYAVVRHVTHGARLQPREALRYTLEAARKIPGALVWFTSRLTRIGKAPSGWPAQQNYMKCAMRYRPRRYPGRITLILCEDHERRGLAKRWRALAGGGLAVQTVPGNHETYLRETPESAAPAIEHYLSAHSAR